MSKPHQSSNGQYQIRVNGDPVYYSVHMDKYLVDEYLKTCRANPEEYVDVVHIRTEILMNQGTYSQIEKHFNGLKS